MQISRRLYSKPAFVVFVLIFLGCFLFLACNMSLNALDAIAYPIDLIPFITGTVVVVNMVKYTKKQRFAKKNHKYNPFPFRSFLCFISSIFIPIVFGYGMKSTACEKVKSFLNEVYSDAQVYINGQKIKDPNQIIDEIKTVALLPVSASHTIKKIHIDIKNHDETLRLVLGRDSRNIQEYWIFYPKYRYTSKNEIGRIITNLFDEY